jgi:hypothetical protein
MSTPSHDGRQIHIIRAALSRDFEPFLDKSAFRHPDPMQVADNLATRALAALVVRDRLDCDAEQAVSMLTEGGQDFGIDAIAISGNAPRVWLIQSKWSRAGSARFGETDVMKMADGLTRIDHRKYERFNTKLRAHSAQLEAVWASPRLKVTLVSVLMRRDIVHDNVIARLDELRESFNAHGAYLDHEILYLPDIWEMVRKSASPEAIDVSVVLAKWFDVSTPMRAINGIVSIADVGQWYEQHGDGLFLKNIRESLGVTRVNADIERTLLEDPYSFWYRNNGITMLCDSVTVTPISRGAPYGAATVEVRNASIINGAQTVASIAAAMRTDSEVAGQATVGIRIIESSQSDVSIEITKSTNTQNHIERRDFVALDPAQVDIREDFRLTLGLTYAIRRSEFEPSPESGCTVREAALALACANASPDLSVRVQQNENLLWEDGRHGAYSRLFGSRPSALQTWRSVLLLREVRDALHKITKAYEGRASTIAEQSTLICAHLVFRHLGRDEIDDADADWQGILDQVPETTERVVRWLIHDIDNSYGKNSFVTGSFGSVDRVRSIVKRVSEGLESGTGMPDLAREYSKPPRQRGPRRPNSVALVVDSGRIPDGDPLTFRPRTGPERIALEKWILEDSRRGVVTWVNNRGKPFVWSADGKGYSPSGLVMKMYSLAEWAEAPVAVQGPARWYLRDGVNLVEMAKRLSRDAAEADLVDSDTGPEVGDSGQDTAGEDDDPGADFSERHRL